MSYNVDVPMAIKNLRYYAGWADKIHGEFSHKVGSPKPNIQ